MPRDQGASPRRLLWVLLALTALVFAPLLAAGFAWDDEHLLPALGERGLGGLSFLTRGLWPESLAQVHGLPVYRPLAELDFQLLLAVAGLRPWVFHLASIAALLLVGGLLWALTRSLLAERGADEEAQAWGATLLVGGVLLHPAHQEAVAFIAARNDLWSAAALLGAALLWRGRRWWLAPAVVLTGLLCKETTAVALLLLPALDLTARQRPRGLALRWGALALAPLAWAGLRFGLARLPGGGLLWPDPGGVAAGLCHAGAMLVGAHTPSPHQPLSLVLQRPGWWLPGAVVLVVLAVALGRDRLGRAGLLVWAAALCMALTFAMRTDTFGDRYLFVADLGLALGAVGLLTRMCWVGWRRALGGLVLLGLAAGNAATLSRWASTEALWAAGARHDPTGYSARMLGLELLGEGRFEEAKQAFGDALAARYPDPAAQQPLAELLLGRGELGEGCALLARSEAGEGPEGARREGLLGLCARLRGDVAGAVAALARAEALEPGCATAALERYALALEAEDGDEARAGLREAGIPVETGDAWRGWAETLRASD